MKALVTGGGGFLGLYIVEQLLEAGHQVRVYCRGRYETLERLGVQVLQGDLKDDAGVRNACQDMEAVFHAAAVPGVWGPWHKYYETNTAGTRNVIAGCLRAGTSRLIYTSSPSVVFDGREHIDADETLQYPTRWLCHYPHSKALAEHAVLEANGCGCLRTVSLRPHLIWGPRDNHLIPRLIQKAASGRLRQVGDGGNVVSIAYVENAAAAHLQAEESLRNSATAAGKAYFINEPQSVNLWDWINNLLERAGMPQVTRCISQRNAVLLGRILESVYGTLGLRSEPPMTRFVALQLSGSHSYSIAAAQRDFGYHPLCTMEEGLARLQPELERLARH
jgi:nucleoside-diphosphate-sugar epimerase